MRPVVQEIALLASGNSFREWYWLGHWPTRSLKTHHPPSPAEYAGSWIPGIFWQNVAIYVLFFVAKCRDLYAFFMHTSRHFFRFPATKNFSAALLECLASDVRVIWKLWVSCNSMKIGSAEPGPEYFFSALPQYHM